MPVVFQHPEVVIVDSFLAAWGSERRKGKTVLAADRNLSSMAQSLRLVARGERIGIDPGGWKADRKGLVSHPEHTCVGDCVR